MNPKALISRAKEEGRKTLTEAESKNILAAYGVPVVTEMTAGSPEEAAGLAAELGFPVVLKGLGSKLTHKTERNLVHLGLTDADQVLEAARAIGRAAGGDLEGWLVQPQISGRREFVAGLFKDDQFGPVIMFGLGGIFTEALDDVVFRLAPLTRSRAEFMVGELKSAALLGEFRGEPAADKKLLVDTLLGLSRLTEDHPEVEEVDINPLMVSNTGQVTAVDALIVLGQGQEKQVFRPPVEPARTGSIFHPKSVAFVGASSQFDKWGHMLFTNVLAGGFKGRIHLVNPKSKTIAGRPVYKSVTDIPESVDLAVVTVPAARVLKLLPEFKAKGIKNMVLITAGFGETGPEGKDLEKRLVEEARANDVLILGPNTMGICNPHHNFHCLGSHARPKPGSTAFVSQSGNMGVQLLSFAEQQGIGIRAFAGSGNEAMLTIEDTLDAFVRDEFTNTVLLYIESVKNGRRFYESARKVGGIKPVVVLKGGRTEAGKQAAASHTGAMASNIRVFDAACRQAGIILADQPMDLLDLSASFSSLPLPKGPRVAIMTLGGGWGVVTSDLCNQYGLQVPSLSEDIIGRIDQLLPPFWSKANPVDLVGDTDPEVPIKVMSELLKWDGCDAVINLGIWGRRFSFKRLAEATLENDPEADPGAVGRIIKMISEFEDQYVKRLTMLMEEVNKPIIGVSLVTGQDDQTVIDVEGSKYKGIFFPSPERAVKALAEMCQYWGWLEREGVVVNG